MAAHINSPFVAVNNGDYWEIHDKNGDPIGDTCAALFDDFGHENQPKGKALAVLFAAAPDLLAEHRNNLHVVGCFEDWQLATLPAWARAVFEMVARNSREAIAKAEGNA